MFRRGEVEIGCVRWVVLAAPSKVSPLSSAPLRLRLLYIDFFFKPNRSINPSTSSPSVALLLGVQALVLDHVSINPTISPSRSHVEHQHRYAGLPRRRKCAIAAISRMKFGRFGSALSASGFAAAILMQQEFGADGLYGNLEETDAM